VNAQTSLDMATIACSDRNVPQSRLPQHGCAGTRSPMVWPDSGLLQPDMPSGATKAFSCTSGWFRMSVRTTDVEYLLLW